MPASKLTFLAGNLFGATVVGLVVVACGGNGGGLSNQTDLGTIAASRILLKPGTPVSGAEASTIRVQANQLPGNVQVAASQVSVIQANNNLQSSDLQSALDKEIAVDNGKSLIGTWDIENTTDDPIYQGTASKGKVTFNSDGSYTLSSGGLAVAGKVVAGTNTFCAIPTKQTYSLVGNNAIYFQADQGGNGFGFIVDSKSNAITLVGQGGCGNVGSLRISKLTRVATPQSATKARSAAAGSAAVTVAAFR